MVEITEKLHKKIATKFPVMNVLLGKLDDSEKGTVIEREIDGHMVTLVVGISNVYIIKAELIEGNDE